jgi:hypothetical protein
MSPLAANIACALMLAGALTLLAAVIGVLFMPQPERRDDPFMDRPFFMLDQPWAAQRCATEDLRNCVSRELPSGEARPAAGRMYATPPAATERSARRLHVVGSAQ